MNENLKICRLSLDDLPEILAIEKASYPDPWSVDSFIGELKRPVTIALGLKEDDKLVGQCFFWLVPPEVHLLNLAILPEARGRGLAIKLLNTLVFFGKKMKAKIIFLEVRQSNESAKKLYEKFGFEMVGIRPNYYDNGENALLMDLILDE